jgi:hypothetical protein
VTTRLSRVGGGSGGLGGGKAVCAPKQELFVLTSKDPTNDDCTVDGFGDKDTAASLTQRVTNSEGDEWPEGIDWEKSVAGPAI